MRLDSLVAASMPGVNHDLALWESGGLTVLTTLIQEIANAGAVDA